MKKLITVLMFLSLPAKAEPLLFSTEHKEYHAVASFAGTLALTQIFKSTKMFKKPELAAALLFAFVATSRELLARDIGRNNDWAHNLVGVGAAYGFNVVFKF